MASKKIQKLQDDLNKMLDQLTKYRILFNEDGHIDSEEQKKLDDMQALINEAQAKIATMQGGKKETSPDNEREKMNKGLLMLKTELESLLLVYGIK